MKNIVCILTMNTKLSALLFLSLSLFLTSCTDDREEPAKVVVMLDLKGGQSTLGQEAMNGFLLGWQNAPTEISSKVYLSLIDTQSDKTATKIAAQNSAPIVSIGTGFTDNNSILETGEYFEKHKVPFLSIGATDPSLPEKFGESIFLIPFGDNAQAAAAAEFAIKKFGKTVAILWDSSSEYTRSLPLYFSTRFKELDGTVALNQSYPETCDISDLAKEINQLQPRPDFIYLSGLPNCIGEVVTSLRRAGIQLPIIGGDGFDTPNLTNSGSISQVWYTTHVWLGSEGARSFVKSYKDTYNKEPSGAFAALGYDSANLLIDLFKRTDSANPSYLYEALENTKDFKGVTGNISYSIDSHVPKKPVWIIEVNNGNKTLADHFIPNDVPPPLISDMQPEILYKIISIDNWEESQTTNTLKLSIIDKKFIHLALESQLEKIKQKFWKDTPSYVVLKLDPKKLKGRLVLESNPGGKGQYYHLYSGSIPMDSITDYTIINSTSKP